MSNPYTRRRGGGRQSGSGSSGFTPSKKRGEFEGKTWYCDCRTGDATARRLPAAHFKVRKEGPNKGRWFYKCQKRDEAQGCGFFLWDDDAKPREEAAVLGGATAAPQGSPPPPYGESSAGAAAAAAVVAGKAAKRKFQEEVDGVGVGEDEETEDDDDEYGWTPSFGTEREIGRVMDGSGNGNSNSNGHTMAMLPPVTPRKALKGTLFTTPGGSGMMTPISHRGNGTGAAAAALLSKAADATTPIPARLSITPSSAGGGGDDVGDSLVPEVIQLLQENGVRLDEETDEALQKALRGQALRMQGLARGRDISRLAVRERNAKIGELQARITALEAELETQKAVISSLNWQRETGQFD